MRRDSCDRENFQDILKRYNNAESFIKEVELCASAVAFPAINELRYAGHHLLKALTSDDQDESRHELNDVEDHCHRAMYEASEAGIGYLLELLKTFELDYKDIPVRETVPEFLDIRLLGQTASAELCNGRIGRTSPVEQVERYMQTFRELKKGTDKLEASRGELNKVKLRQARENRKFIAQAIFWIAVVLIGIAGIVSQP